MRLLAHCSILPITKCSTTNKILRYTLFPSYAAGQHKRKILFDSPWMKLYRRSILSQKESAKVFSKNWQQIWIAWSQKCFDQTLCDRHYWVFIVLSSCWILSTWSKQTNKQTNLNLPTVCILNVLLKLLWPFPSEKETRTLTITLYIVRQGIWKEKSSSFF